MAYFSNTSFVYFGNIKMKEEMLMIFNFGKINFEEEYIQK